jgi:hypothetical protein
LAAAPDAADCAVAKPQEPISNARADFCMVINVLG